VDERRRRDENRSLEWTRIPIAGGRPEPQPPAGDQPRRSVEEHERAVRQIAVRGRARAGPLLVQPRIDLVRAASAGKGEERVVVLAAAERARPVPGRESRRLVEEEQLGEPPRL